MQERPYKSVLIISMLMMAFMLSGCSISDITNRITSQGVVMGDLARGEEAHWTEEGLVVEEPRPYYDEKTGTYVTAVEYRANSVSDNVKSYGVIIVISSIVLGTLLRLLGRRHAPLMKMGFMFKYAIPIVGIIFIFAVAILADRIPAWF